MKTIFVRKIFPYDPTEKGKHSLYKGYCNSTMQLTNPSITHVLDTKLPEHISQIFSSPLHRAIQTAIAFQETYKIAKVDVRPQLSEILFDLEKLVSEREFNKEGDTLVRQRFVEAFIADTLGESRESIKMRVDSLLEELEELSEGTYLLVCHSFFMKILQIYLRNKNLFAHPEILRKEFDITEKTFPFGGGFSFQVK